MKRLVYGVCVNDADYVVKRNETIYYADGSCKRKQAWICPFYRTWIKVLQRCFCEKFKARRPTYKDVTCCEEWLVFSNFKSWMEQQEWEGKELDKDILVPENKVYSPETCAFVSQATNLFVLARGADRGEWPLGVSWHKMTSKFQASCCNPFTKKKKRGDEYLGCFHCPKEAHEAWRKRKHELAQLVAELESDPRIVEALKKRYSSEVWYGNKKEG